jgi:hypothetical protein
MKRYILSTFPVFVIKLVVVIVVIVEGAGPGKNRTLLPS